MQLALIAPSELQANQEFLFLVSGLKVRPNASIVALSHYFHIRQDTVANIFEPFPHPALEASQYSPGKRVRAPVARVLLCLMPRISGGTPGIGYQCTNHPE